ncbi:phage portal protein [Clostridium manihotivorum]|uniref:Phage portal protein n=2 Tax=Clostridium manihotivorum TaxID=2320868 RepID=A0A410DQC0_9CLOT|nr:phage portal protein [Clostridium manihotivorum]
MRPIGLFNFTKKNVTKAINTARSKLYEGYFNQVITIPPSMNTSDFLRAYGQIGWLFACVNRISQNVASNEWKAYKGETVQQSSLALNVLKRPNPFMSQFQLMWKTVAFLELTGKCYWYIAKDGIGRPKEIWCISPMDMWVVPDKDNYIKGYMYKAGAQQIPLSVDEVIAFQLPDLINPYSGVGPSQAAANDLEADKYTSQYVRNFFYNDAKPAGIVNFPDISDEDYERAKAQWNDKYKGVENSNKIAFARGGEVTFTPITMNIKDLDVSNLKDKSRDGILGTFGVPKSILGITDDVNRANAETAEYTFAKHTIKPVLQLIQDILNNEYVPMFKEQSELKFVDPVPENKEFTKSVLDSQVDKSITKNEAREVLNKLLGLNLKPLIGGDVIYQPVTQQPMGTALPTQQSAPKEDDKPVEEEPPNEPTKSVKKNMLSKGVRKKIARLIEKNNKTRQEDFLKLAEPLQNEFNKIIKSYFNDMQKDVVSKILDGSKDPVDLKKWNKELQDKTIALYVKCFKAGGESVVNEFKDIGNYIHKDTGVSFNIKDPKVQQRIKNKVSNITKVNDDTKDRVKDIIEDLYNSEDDFTIREIAKKIAAEDFYEFSPARAKTVAQTETMTSLNQATIEGYKQNSDLIDGKAWLPSYHNTRQSHIDAGNEYSMDSPISVDEPFNVGGYDCECPGDDSLPASEVVNCACCMSPVINI